MTQLHDDPRTGQFDTGPLLTLRRPSYAEGFARDLAESIRRWQLWWLLGYNDVRQRYRR